MKFRSSQAMLYIFFVMAIAAIFVTSLGGMWENVLSSRYMDENNILAFYAAQSGLEHGKVFAWVNNTTATSSNSPCLVGNTTWCNDMISYSSTWNNAVGWNTGVISGKPTVMWYQFNVTLITSSPRQFNITAVGAVTSQINDLYNVTDQTNNPNNCAVLSRRFLRVKVTVNGTNTSEINGTWQDY